MIENNSNVIAANEILGAHESGILIQPSQALVPATGNLVGGDSEEEENLISGSGKAAVTIRDESGSGEESENEVARNRGSENEELFIDLVGGEANSGIAPPSIAVAKTTAASGAGAEPGALVRVFRKASSEPGELAAFVGEALADGAGNWQVTYASAIPEGTIVAATQTSAVGGTSELSLAIPEPGTEPEPGGGEKGDTGGGKGGGAGGSSSGAAGSSGSGAAVQATPDRTPPRTKLLAGPPKKSRRTGARFEFGSDESGASFRCKLDDRAYQVCGSPQKYKLLRPGEHLFKVRAVDEAGNIDPTAAKFKFTVLG